MILIPQTSKQLYTSGFYALNSIYNDECIGDWHDFILENVDASTDTFFYGDGQPKNTNPMLGDLGIDGTQALATYGT
ncbi:hypothetical protein [Helicobacter labacensis]|uniref:hypothetical protein n=1 Tax=Helicobacter labacensis TaxID=2316079 RepID=UPI000EB5C223|nr:hypothetical protein [Helicobacter labacensis]